MKLHIVDEGNFLSDANRTEIETRFATIDKHLESFNEDMEVCTLTVDRVGEYLFELKFDMWLPGKEHIFAKSENKDFHIVVTDVRDKVIQQIETYKGKLNN